MPDAHDAMVIAALALAAQALRTVSGIVSSYVRRGSDVRDPDDVQEPPETYTH